MKTKKLPKAIRPEEFKLLIKAVPKNNNKTKIAYLLAYGSGMRISEVLRCEPKHFREHSIFIPESKNGVERVVPVPKGWKKEFLRYLPIPSLSISSGSRKLQMGFKRHIRKAKLNPEYTFHSLRHGFATRMIESGVPLNQVQVLLGHSNISTTSVYVRANPLDAIKSYEDLF